MKVFLWSVDFLFSGKKKVCKWNVSNLVQTARKWVSGVSSFSAMNTSTFISEYGSPIVKQESYIDCKVLSL